MRFWILDPSALLRTGFRFWIGRFKRGDIVFLTLVALLFALGGVVSAQQQTKVARIGYFTVRSASTAPDRDEAFRLGLRELGYIEGKNIFIEWRFADGKLDRLPALAADLAHLQLDVIVSAGPTNTRVLKDAAGTTPIVMAQDSDPVGNGFISSLARPGGNITGLSAHYPEISGKQLELLKETVSRVSRVAVLGNSAEPGNLQAFKEVEPAAPKLKVQVRFVEIKEAKDFSIAFRSPDNGRAEAMLLLATPFFNSRRKQIAELATKNRLPAIYYSAEWVEDGGLLSYGVNLTDLHRRAAIYVDKILKGAKPAELPVEQPTKFELVINLKTAKQIGLTIPPNVLARADRVIR
jgi:putative ABC transport system substrate-binding protein